MHPHGHRTIPCLMLLNWVASKTSGGPRERAFREPAHRRRIGVSAKRPSPSVYLQRLAALGRASLPKGDLLELGPPPRLRRARRLSEALLKQRTDRL